MLEMDENMYYYRIYGLNISSEIRLYNVSQVEIKSFDLNVKLGKLSDVLSESLSEGILSAMNRERVWFKNDSGIYFISKGNEIIIEPAKEDYSEEELASFVLGWGISFVFQQRGIPAIHSTALDVNGKAVLISGGSGAGKSTTALELIRRGYKYLTDDISMVDINNDMLVNPGFPIQKVCRDVAGSVESERLTYIDERKDKFAYYNTEEFCNEPRKLSTLFIIEKYDGESVTVEEPKGLDKWNRVANSLFLLDAYRCLEFPLEEKQRCLQIAGKISVIVIKRPAGKDTLTEVCDLIESKVN